VLVHEGEAERAFQSGKQFHGGLLDGAVAGSVCQQTTDEVGVGSRSVWALVVDQAGCASAARGFSGVHQVAVVAEGDARACRRGAEDGLRVLPRRGPGRGVAAMSDGDVTWHRCEGLLVEHLADQPEILEHQHLGAVGHRNAGSFLTTVL